MKPAPSQSAPNLKLITFSSRLDKSLNQISCQLTSTHYVIAVNLTEHLKALTISMELCLHLQWETEVLIIGTENSCVTDHSDQGHIHTSRHDQITTILSPQMLMYL
jgi:hypothetical protein